jgi:nucleoside phosphorylase
MELAMRRAVIFTAKDTETKAVKEQLLGPVDGPRTVLPGAYDIYELKTAVNKDEPVKDLQIAFYETGRGQDNVMQATPPIVGDFKPDIVLYVGCAGGDPDELKKYDVFVPTQVWPYEKGKETTSGFKPTAHPLEPTRYLRDMVTSIAKRQEWRARIPNVFQGSPEVKTGGLASGNKVLADEEGEIWKSAKNINDEIVAVETECYGFFKSMEPLHRPYLMIRGISDLHTNKNADGKNADDNHQTEATAYAAALAAQLILDADYNALQQTRGTIASPLASKLVGFWSSESLYGSEKLEDLINIVRIDDVGRVSGRRVSKMPGHEYVYDVTGTLAGDLLHLTAISTSRGNLVSVGLVLKVQLVGNYDVSLTGIAIRPLGKRPLPALGRNVVLLYKRALKRVQGSDLWGSVVNYKKLIDPKKEAACLWDVYVRHR